MFFKLKDTIQSSKLLQNTFLVLIWSVAWNLGFLSEYENHASFFFPPAGVTFAALLMLGRRALPALIFCSITSTVWVGFLYNSSIPFQDQLLAGLYFSLAHIIPYYLGASLLHLIIKKTQFDAPLSIISFLLITPVISFVTAILVLKGLIHAGMLEAAALQRLWLVFWVGDMVGLIILVPLCSGLIYRYYPVTRINLDSFIVKRSYANPQPYLYKLAISLLFITIAMLLASRIQAQESTYLIYFLIIPQMWITFTESPIKTTISIAINSLLIIILIDWLNLEEFLLAYQFAITVIAASSYFGFAVPTLAEANSLLRQQVLTDSLTKVGSREYLLRQTELEIERSRLYKTSLVFCVVDIDHFKSINDQHGHLTGDKILVELCEIVQHELQSGQTLARYGGDEFVILLPRVTLKQAHKTTLQILASSRQLTKRYGFEVTVSIGAADFDPKDNFNSLFSKADKNLYQAKRMGRNQVVIGPQDNP